MSKPRVGLDAGHGVGNRRSGVYDPGAVGNGVQEHVIVEGLVQRLKSDAIYDSKFEPVLTSGPLTQRDDRAKKAGVDLFISFHCNSGSSKATGVEVWMDGSGKKATRYSKAVLSGVSKTLGIPSRGIKKTSALAVLHANKEDALTELMFVSDGNDVKKYQAHTDDVELVVYNAILSALGLKPVSVLPRKKGNKPEAVHDEPGYKEFKAHISVEDEKAYIEFAKAHGDACKFTDTTKDSWKSW